MMKKNILKAGGVLLLSLIFWSCSSTKNIQKLDTSDITQMVKDQQFHFIADKMDPMRGPERILNAYYDLRVDQDTLNSFLPYFGRVFVPPADPTNGGLRFNSYSFKYNYSEKDNKWTVTIVPKDITRVSKLYFTIFNNGNATLQISSIDLDPISFQGHLEKVG